MALNNALKALCSYIRGTLFPVEGFLCKCQYKNVGKMENKNVGFSIYSSAA